MGIWARESYPENHQMLQYADPVSDRERGRQWKQDHQLRCCDAEEKEISQSSPKHVRHAKVREQQIYLPNTLGGFALDPNCDGTGPEPGIDFQAPRF